MESVKESATVLESYYRFVISTSISLRGQAKIKVFNTRKGAHTNTYNWKFPSSLLTCTSPWYHEPIPSICLLRSWIVDASQALQILQRASLQWNPTFQTIAGLLRYCRLFVRRICSLLSVMMGVQSMNWRIGREAGALRRRTLAFDRPSLFIRTLSTKEWSGRV